MKGLEWWTKRVEECKWKGGEAKNETPEYINYITSN